MRRGLPGSFSRAAIAAFLLTAGVAAADDSGRTFDVLRYEATVEPDLESGSVKGRVSVDVLLADAQVPSIRLDIGALTIDSVREAGVILEFTAAERSLSVSLPPGKSRKHRVEIDYHGAPRFGLQFVPGKRQAYTIFSTSQWMPCIDAPSERASLALTIVAPKDLVVVATGSLVSTRTEGDARVVHRFRLDREAPSFTFGFAVAPFNDVASTGERTALRFLSTEASKEDLSRAFSATGAMIDFFEERSGVRYPHRTYAQALVAETVGQEMSGLSLMSDAYGREVIADPQRVGLIAHELAHQWWGIGLTCEDWTHFWLNEGFATFMAAAFRERQFGRDAYLKDVEGWRARYERIRSAGNDKSLVFPAWNRPSSDDRALVYQKGALVLHELRESIGEKAFWKGLRDYTRANFGKSVTTRVFERAMEKAFGQSLASFFDERVYLKASTP